MDEDPIVREFTHQSEAFNAAPAMRSEEALGRLLDLIPAAPGERWLDSACGPGLVARGLAARVGEVHGVHHAGDGRGDQREAEREGAHNASFSLGDATALAFAADSFDGAVTRFSCTMCRRPAVWRPSLAATCGRAASSWSRPRRPWTRPTWPPGTRRSSAGATRRMPSCPGCLRELGSGPAGCAGVTRAAPYCGSTSRSGSPAAAAARPPAILLPPGAAEQLPVPEVFRVVDGPDGRRLELVYWLSRWRVPSPAAGAAAGWAVGGV